MPAEAAASAPTIAGMAPNPALGVVGHAASASTFISPFHPDGRAQTCRSHFRVQQALMPEPRTLPLVVASVADLTPHMRRIQLSGPSLDGFEYFPGQDLALPVVRDDGSIVRRRYTIRRFDPGTQLLDLDFVMHGDGPGIRWAQAAQPGLAVEAIGPRGKIGLAPRAKWHLFAGDATALPGAFTMMEALAAGVRASAHLMVADPVERQPFSADATKTVT